MGWKSVFFSHATPPPPAIEQTTTMRTDVGIDLSDFHHEIARGVEARKASEAVLAEERAREKRIAMAVKAAKTEYVSVVIDSFGMKQT